MRVERPTHSYSVNSIKMRTDLSQVNTFQQMLSKKTQDAYTTRTEPSAATEILSSAPTEVKMSKLAEIAAQSDYTGMSYDEIYNTIWNRYNEAFDGNMTAIDGGVGGPASWSKIKYQLSTELFQNIVRPIQREIRLSAGGNVDHISTQDEALGVLQSLRLKSLGYERMSFDEIESAIQKKYAGKDTTLDYLNMQGELRITGCLRNKLGEKGQSNYLTMLKIQFETTYNPNNPFQKDGAHFMSEEQWEGIANQTFDSHQLATAMKDQLSRMTFEGDQSKMEKILLSAIDQFIMKNILDYRGWE